MEHLKQLVLLFIITSFTLQAQQPITIADALKKASNQNIGLKISAQEIAAAQGDYRQSNALFIPQITASHTGITTNNPLMAFGAKLNQAILTAADFNPTLLNNPAETRNYSTQISVLQPLINIDGLYQRNAAKNTVEAIRLKDQRNAEYLNFEVKKSYMQLQLAYKSLAVIDKAILTAIETQKLAKISHEQGLIQYADVLAVNLRVSELENQLQIANNAIAKASNYLSFLMNDSNGTQYLPTTALAPYNTTASQTVSDITERADIKAMSFSKKAYKAMNTADKMRFLPRLNAFGSYDLHADSPFKGNANGYVFGAQLSWDILNGGKRFGKTKKSTAMYKKATFEYEQYLSKSAIELSHANNLVSSTKNQLALTQNALTYAKEALRIRKNRFKEGLEKTIDLLHSETQYAKAELQYYQTVFAYNYAVTYYHFLTTK